MAWTSTRAFQRTSGGVASRWPCLYLPESKWSVVSWLRRQGILDNYLSIIMFLAINSFKYHLREAPFRKTSTLGVLFLQWHKVCRISQEASDLLFSKFFWVKTVLPSLLSWGLWASAANGTVVFGRGAGWGAPEPLSRYQVDTHTW